jgi:HlyD family secretion protein
MEREGAESGGRAEVMSFSQEPRAQRSTEADTSASKGASPRSEGERQAQRSALSRELGRVEKRRWTKPIGVVLGLAALVGAGVGYRIKTRPPPPARYITAELTRGDVLETVQSTGQIKPTTEVQVGAQVSGRITKVYVDFNSRVKRGQVLAEIDPTLFGAQIESNRAQVASATASVSRAQANLATATQKIERAKRLVAEGIGTQADLDTAQGAYDVALADLAAARAQVAQFGAQLKSSSTNLEYTRIYSPIDGMVISRDIDPGQVVAASFQAPTLFVIAEDLTKMRVLADIDEADVGKLKERMEADIRVDAFPGDTFKGVVSQLRYNANNVSGVVTYAAIIDVENPDMKLRPGMTATVSIVTAEARAASRIPNAALRFKPSPPKDGGKGPAGDKPGAPRTTDNSSRATGRVFVLVDATPGAEVIEPRTIELGVSDGVNSATSTDLGGLKLVIDEADSADGSSSDKPKGGRRLF